MGARIPIIYKQ